MTKCRSRESLVPRIVANLHRPRSSHNRRCCSLVLPCRLSTSTSLAALSGNEVLGGHEERDCGGYCCQLLDVGSICHHAVCPPKMFHLMKWTTYHPVMTNRLSMGSLRTKEVMMGLAAFDENVMVWSWEEFQRLLLMCLYLHHCGYHRRKLLRSVSLVSPCCSSPRQPGIPSSISAIRQVEIALPEDPVECVGFLINDKVPNSSFCLSRLAVSNFLRIKSSPEDSFLCKV